MFDGIPKIDDWNKVFLSSVEVGGEYLILMPKVIEFLDAIKKKESLAKEFDEEYISSFLKTTIPKTIDKIINFHEITKQDEIDILIAFFNKIVEIIPNIQTYLCTESIESFSQLFDINSKIIQQNKSNIFYPKIVNSFINCQEEIINTLKSMDLNENINYCYFYYLISSIYDKIKQSKKRISGLNRYLSAITNNFYDFINTNISNFHFFSNKKIIEILSKTFDLILNFLDKKETAKLYVFFEENIILQNVNIQLFISQCLSKLCQNPKHASMLYSIISKTQKIINYLLSYVFNPNILIELKQFYYFIIGNGMINLKFLIDFWNLYSKTQLFELNDIYIDLIVYSLKFIDQNCLSEFIGYVKNGFSKFYLKLLSKIVLEFQNNEETEKTSIECLKLILSIAKNNEYAKNQLLNLIESKLSNNLSEYLISELLQLLKNNENIDFACLIIDSIINFSSDPSNLFDKETIFESINKNNEEQIIHILIQLSLKTRTKLNTHIFGYLQNKQNINDDIWNLMKEILYSNIYQNNKDINKFLDIAKKQNIKNVSLPFVKFLKLLVFKFSNKNLLDNDYKSPFRIFTNSINGLDLILNVYLCNDDPKIISSSKNFLLKIFEGWNHNYSINYLNNQLDYLLEKEKSKEKLIKFLQLILNFIQNEIDVDPEDFSCPRHFYPKNYLQLTIIIKNYSAFKIKYTIHFNKSKTLQNLKERISKIENIKIDFIQFENYSISQINKSLDECGITNNSELEVSINSMEKEQLQNDDQKTPSFYFSQINFQDKLLSIFDKRELDVNSIAWDILQLLPTSKSIMYISNLSEALIEFDSNYKKLYLIQVLCKKKNIFNSPDVMKYVIELFQMDYLKEPIIYILKLFYTNEDFNQCTDISIMLLEFINQAEDDEIINILNLLLQMSKNNNFDFIIGYFDKLGSLDEKYFDTISNLFHCALEKSQIKDEILLPVISLIKNDFEKSKISLKIVNRAVEFINKSDINSLYQEIIDKLQIHADIYNEQKTISLLLSDILECLSNIIQQNEFLTQKANFPVNFLTDILFDPNFNEMQIYIFKLISVYLQIVKNQDMKNKIILKINEVIMNTNNSYNYDPLMNKKTDKYTGLQNLGATCYINSVFQQIYHLFPVRYLLCTSKSKNCEFTVVQKIMIQMSYTKRPSINIFEFFNKWKGWKNRNINPKEQQDSVEFFHYLIESFPKKIKDLFKGEIINYINEEISSNESFYYLNIPIKNRGDIYSSFDSYIYKNNDEIISSKISKLPSIFVVQLDRFEYSNALTKINDKFIFPIELNIEQLCTDECKQNQSQLIYNLNGIIIHKGVASSGHYISLIRKENEWICFNDEKVTKMNYEDAYNLSIGQKEVGSSAYVLFYTKNSDDLKIQKQKKISFNEDFDFTKEINNYYLNQIFKDNEIWEKNQMLYDKNTIEFIQMIDDPLLNISFFIKVLCHSINYQQSDIFISNLKKIIMDKFNSIDSSQLLLECADYLIENSEDIFNCYLHCSNSFMLTNLTNFILFFFNYLDKIMSLPENTILIDDDNDDNYSSPSHEKSLIFFNKFGDQIINPSNSIEKVIEIVNLISKYISKHTIEALNSRWAERLMKTVDNIYGIEIASKRIDYSKLNISNVLNTLNSLFIKCYSVDLNYISKLIKYGSKIKLSNENVDSYENMIIDNIIPSINQMYEDEEYSELEKISSDNYLILIKSLNIFNRSEKIPNYSLLVFRKQKELLIFVANHNKDHCRILLKAKFSLLKKPYIKSNSEKTFINEINLQNDDYVYCATIHNVGEILIAQNGDVLLNSLTFDHSLLIKTADSVIINSCNIKKLFVDSKNVIITNEDEVPTKIESLKVNCSQNTSSLYITNKSVLEINTLKIENSLITNYGLLLMTNIVCNNCSILNNGKIITKYLKNIGFLFNTSLGTIESDTELKTYAINLYNFGEIKCKSLTIIADSTFINNDNITVDESILVYSENIENHGTFKTDKISFIGNSFKQYQEGYINAITTQFNSNKTECEGKLEISNISFYNDENSKTNNAIIFNNIEISDIKKILIYQCCEVLIGEKTKIMSIGSIKNNGEFVIKTQIGSIENINNESSGMLYIINKVNVNSIVNKGRIVVLGKKKEGEFCSLYVGHKTNPDIITLNIESKFIGIEDSTLEIANEGALFISEFQSSGLTFSHRYLNIYESHINNSNANNFYGSVASQDGITFNSYDKALIFSHQLIEPSIENKEKIFKVINERRIIINDN